MKIRWISRPHSKSSWPAASSHYRQKLLAKAHQDRLDRQVLRDQREGKDLRERQEAKDLRAPRVRQASKAPKADLEPPPSRQRRVPGAERESPPMEEAAALAAVVEQVARSQLNLLCEQKLSRSRSITIAWTPRCTA